MASKIVPTNIVPTKEVRVYVYKCSITGTENSVKNLGEIFNIKNITTNLIPGYGDVSLLFIVDRVENSFLLGKFIKLRKDSPSVRNIVNGDSHKISLLASEDIEEISHLVWNVRDNYIFSEYNFNAIRYLSSPLVFYLNERFKVTGNKVTPKEDIDTYKRFKKVQGRIDKFKVKVKGSKISDIEEIIPVSCLSGLLLDSSDDAYYEIIISRGRKKDSALSLPNVLGIADKLNKKSNSIDSLEIETEDSKYDLIHNNLISYTLEVLISGKEVDTEDIYSKIQNIYLSKIDYLKSTD